LGLNAVVNSSLFPTPRPKPVDPAEVVSSAA
jgi:hypothetical protein